MKRQRVDLWTDRSGQLDLLRAALEGERATDESQRKSQAVRRATSPCNCPHSAIAPEFTSGLDGNGPCVSSRASEEKLSPEG